MFITKNHKTFHRKFIFVFEFKAYYLPVINFKMFYAIAVLAFVMSANAFLPSGLTRAIRSTSLTMTATEAPIETTFATVTAFFFALSCSYICLISLREIRVALQLILSPR